MSNRKHNYPKTHDGNQLNYCLNLSCSSYGKPPVKTKKIHDSCNNCDCKNHQKSFKNFPELYTNAGKNNAGNNILRCKACAKKITPRIEEIYTPNYHVKDEQGRSYAECVECNKWSYSVNNKSFIESINNLYKYTKLDEIFIKNNSCKNTECENHNKPYQLNTKSYVKQGKNTSGNPRIKCKSCNKVFTMGDNKKPHKSKQKNLKILESIINGLGIRRTAELNKVSPKTVYDKIDYFYIKCLKFNRKFEDKYKSKKREWLNVAIDQLILTTNWRTKITDSKADNVTSGRSLMLYASTDLYTGFLVDTLLNFDSTVKSGEINKLAQKNNDLTKQTANKIYDQYKLNYNNRSNDYIITKNHKKLPTYGMGIRKNYATLVHLYFIKNILKNTKNITFYTDGDRIFSTSIKRIFNKEILDNKVEHISTTTRYKPFKNKQSKKDKKMTKKEWDFYRKKEELLIQSLRSYWDLTVGTDREYIKIDKQTKGVSFSNWQTKRDEKLLPNEYKIHKKSGEKIDHIFKQKHATLHTTDNYFQMIRAMSFFGRKTATGTKDREDPSIWAYDKAYNPEYILKLSEIYKTYYNFIKTQTPKKGLKKEDCTTPAQRAKLTKKIFTFSDVLNGKY